MKAVITVSNKKNHASRTVSGLYASIAATSVVELSVDSIKDITSLQRQGNALVITLLSGELLTLDDFYLNHKGVNNSMVIHDGQGLITPPLEATGQPVLEESQFVKINSIQPLLERTALDVSPWWLAGGPALGGVGSNTHTVTSDHITMGTAKIAAVAADTGIVGDFVTSSPKLVVTATFNGMLASGERLQISVDVGASWHDAVAVGGNTYAYDNSANVLSDGARTFEVRVVSAAGTPGVVSSQVVVIDTVAPVAAETISIAHISNDTGLSASDVITSDNILSITGNFGTPLLSGESTYLVDRLYRFAISEHLSPHYDQ